MKLLLPLAVALVLLPGGAWAQSWSEAIAMAVPVDGVRVAADSIDGARWPAYVGRTTCPAAPDSVAILSTTAAAPSGMFLVPYVRYGGEQRRSPVLLPRVAEPLRARVVEARCDRAVVGRISLLILEVDGAALLFEGGASLTSVPAIGPDGELGVLEHSPELQRMVTAEERARAIVQRARAREAELRSRGWSQRAVDAVIAQRIYIGMNAEMVRESWGAPDDINRTISRSGVSEQWVYGLSSYVYFDNGVVTTIQN